MNDVKGAVNLAVYYGVRGAVDGAMYDLIKELE